MKKKTILVKRITGSEAFYQNKRFNKAGIVWAKAVACLPNGKKVAIQSTGKGDTHYSKRMSCYGELAERIQMLEATADLHASFSEIQDAAVDPRLLVLDAKVNLTKDVSHFEPSLRIAWSQATNLLTGRKKYIHRPQRGEMVRFYKHTSSGCAAGLSKDHAITNAIFELIERDAFMKIWFSKKGAYRLKIFSENVPLTNWLTAHGFSCSSYDITSEIGIPVCMVVASNKQIKDLPVEGSVFGCASSFKQQDAQRKALLEIIQTVEYFLLVRDFKDRRFYFDKHISYYLFQNRSNAYSFLFQATTVPQVLKKRQTKFSVHLAQKKVITIAEWLSKYKLQTWVVERKPVVIRSKKFYVVEVFIPGLQPHNLEMGKKNRRLNSIFFRQFSKKNLNQYPHPL